MNSARNAWLIIALALVPQLTTSCTKGTPESEEGRVTYTASDAPSPAPPAEAISTKAASSVRLCERLSGKKVLANLSVLDPADWTYVNSADLHPQKNCDGYPVSSQPPVYAPLGDGQYFVLANKLRYRLGSQKRPVFVPRGFVTDLASIPNELWSLLPRDGNYVSAAIVHDYLYWDQRCTRKQSDLILRNEMVSFGVDKSKVWSIYTAVDLKGEAAWTKNAKEKATRIRVVPQAYLDKLLEEDMDASRTLSALERQMLAEGVKPLPDSENPNIREICLSATR